MNKSEFNFNVVAWLNDYRVRAMSPEQKGYYIDLLAHIWREQFRVKYDRPSLINLLHIQDEKDLDIILECCYEENGFVYQKRLKTAWDKYQGVSTSRSQSAHTRWGNGDVKKEPPKPKPEPVKNGKKEERDARLTRKKKEFYDTLNKYYKANKGKYPVAMYKEFFDYWGIPENKATPQKLVYENEKSWNLAGRLATWYKRYKEDHARGGEDKENPTRGSFVIGE